MSDAQERWAAESEIRNLVARLGHLADDGDLDEYITLFTDDAVWAGPTGTHQGRADILAGAHQRRNDRIQGPGTDTRHVNTTLWVEVVGDGEAKAQSYFLYLHQAGTASPVIAGCGRYDDTFRRTSDGWKLASRNISGSGPVGRPA